LLSAITIPGTHDAGALYDPVYAPGTTKCQNLSISDQLIAGVRFLDIRCHHENDRFAIYHGPIYENQLFDDVLRTCIAFLTNDSTETIIMSVQDEGGGGNCTRSFEDTFVWYSSWNANLWYLGDSFPRLGEVRGKIVLVRSFSAQNHLPLGIPTNDGQDNSPHSTCDNGNIVQQGWYEVTDNNLKYKYITDLLSEAASGPKEKMYMNWTNGYHPGLFGIPDIHWVSDFINGNVQGYFSFCPVARYGIVILNFADAHLCELIYSKN
jgi:1-phosphatidylinositol phosphodiesterase